jgi:streptogramin lyase
MKQRKRYGWKLVLVALLALALLLSACGPEPTPTPEPTTVVLAPTETPVPPTDTPVPPVTPSPEAGAMPDPRTDPAGALRYTDFPASLGSVGFTSTFLLTADPEENWGYGIETARSFGTIHVVDYDAGEIDMEVHVNFSIATYGQDLHVIRSGDRAWARFAGIQWQEIPADTLESDDWERMVWGGWHPLNALEPFDSATEVEWVEDVLLDGEPAHHLRVVFDPEKMQHLDATAKARYEYQWYHLVGAEAGYGTPTSVDVQADVWLAAEDLAVRQIDMLIQVVTQEDSGGEKTTCTITRTVHFDAGDPDAIAEPVLDAGGTDETDCSGVTEITEAECRALVALYEGTGGEAWTDVEGWLTGGQPCTWGGVTCRGGHVLWLILTEAGLSGTLPPELGDLRWLQVLYLKDNDLRGSIPPEIGAMGDLQALDLGWNLELSGPIPDEIGDLRNLMELNLFGSDLAGPLPGGLKDTKLTILEIAASDLCVPDEPDWRDWVDSIGYLGMDVAYEGVETIYCSQQPLSSSTGTPEAAVPTPTPSGPTPTPVAPSSAPPGWTTYTTADGLASKGVFAVAVAPDGAMWFGSAGSGGGASRFDGTTWTTYTTADGLSSENVSAVAFAHDGAVWFGTYDHGVSRFDGKAWTSYLGSLLVGDIAVALDGTLWFGTILGASRFDGQDWTTYTKADGLARDDANAVAVAPDGTVWFGTGGGVSRFDGQDWTTYTTADGLVDNKVWAIAVAPDGAVWFGTGGGVSRFDGKTWTTYTAADGLADDEVWAIAAAPDGAVWFGTSGGASRFDGKTWTTYTTVDGLAGDQVNAVAVGPDGAVWFGTGSGVLRYLPPR